MHMTLTVNGDRHLQYQYDPEAPPHAELDVAELDQPIALVGVTHTGSLHVVADTNVPLQAVRHALDYADRLAELIPKQQRIIRTHGQRRTTP